ncbi:hypothetical protein FRC17_002371, partial [Serendipita sp. 399]
MADLSKKQADMVGRTKDISRQLRDQIRASMPTPPEQFLTIMIPGKVLNLKDYNWFDDQGNATSAEVPTDVVCREAMLVDDMPAMDGLQMGPTGKSIANAYSATLDKLVPSGTTIGVDRPANPKDSTDPQTKYDEAMKWLAAPSPLGSGEGRIERYTHFQTIYAEVVEEKLKAYNAAKAKALELYPKSIAQQKAYFEDWVQENYQMYNNKAQATYMQWVIQGEKEKVEYYFSIVDVTSASERIELSKKSMRDSRVATPDGAAEFSRVTLEPSNWAFIASQKALQTVIGRSPDKIQYEISRLQYKKATLNQAKAQLAGTSTEGDPAGGTSTEETDTALDNALNTLMTKSQAYEQKRREVAKIPSPTDQQKAELETARKEKEDAAQAAAKARKDHDDKTTSALRNKIASQSAKSLDVIKGQLDADIEGVVKEIAQLEKELEDTLKKSGVITNIVTDALGDTDDSSSQPPSGDTGSGGKPAPSASLADYWTSISLEMSSSESSTSQTDSSTSFSAGGSASWGLFSVGGSASHSSANSDVSNKMAKLETKISFDVMRVDITRPWLRSEFFYDSSFDVAPNEKISPGPALLSVMMDPVNNLPPGATVTKEERERALYDYSLFPFYSTAFLLAANLVLEFKGDTSDISAHFHSSSTSGSVKVGYGPFSVSSSASHSKSDQNTSCVTTSEGCRITTKAPQ